MYFGKVGESEAGKVVLLFPYSAPSLKPQEEIIVSYELSYLTIEAKGRFLFREGERYFFLLDRALRRRKGFMLPWNLEVRFLKIEGETKDLVKQLMRNPQDLKRARTEAIGGERIVLLVEDGFLKAGDRVAILLSAYGRHFIVPGRVTRVENLGFACRVLVEDFALPEREIDHLYGLIFQRQAELRTRLGVARSRL